MKLIEEHINLNNMLNNKITWKINSKNDYKIYILLKIYIFLIFY